jgi:hypothetical protein
MATGDVSPQLAEYLSDMKVSHFPTRVDACEDWVEEGLFNRISGLLIGYAYKHDISIDQKGDWVRGQARTLYLGSKSSVTRLVLYEKGYEAGGDIRWVRLEVRVRPSRHAREEVSNWNPGQCFGASRWLTEALACIGWNHLQASSVGTVYRPSDADRTRMAMAKQYRKVFLELLGEVGSWEGVGLKISCLLDEASTSVGVVG